jgi:hypothetical protein
VQKIPIKLSLRRPRQPVKFCGANFGTYAYIFSATESIQLAKKLNDL